VLLMVGILFAAIGVTIIIVKCAMRCCNLWTSKTTSNEMQWKMNERKKAREQDTTQ
jgi:hypothetical protein